MRFVWYKVGIDWMSTNEKRLYIKFNTMTGKYELYDLSEYNNLIGSFMSSSACKQITEFLC